jgi:hypothetical protein
MALPKKVKIGAQDWVIAERTQGEDGLLNDSALAYTLERGNIIVIDKDLTNSRKRQVLLHELLHAIYCSATKSGIKPDMEDAKPESHIDIWEHYFIGIYENHLLAVLRDNPTLAKFLLEKDS